jgi:hypothetical protein
MVEDFAPSAEEQALYEQVSSTCAAETAAIEPGKRTLLTLVYRKLLASSTFAIAPTLRKLAESLQGRIAAARAGAAAARLFEPEETQAFAEESEAWSDEPATQPGSVASLEAEARELEQYASRAEAVRVNAKGEALKRALDRLFTVARAQRWPEKAVVFTESRRTQAYLADCSPSTATGASRCSPATPPRPRSAGRWWSSSGSESDLLISTEAGAEGLNLQFCNLVVNYDLP